MSIGKPFLAPILRSKSFSYDTLMEFSAEDISKKSRPSTSALRCPYGTFTHYDSVDDKDAFAETSEPVSKQKRQSLTTSNSSISRPSRLSQWITRITPPFLLPADVDSPAYMVRNDNNNGINGTGRQDSPTFDSSPAAKFSAKNKLVIVTLSAATLCSTVVFSCIAPFFPAEAKQKGASDTVTGFVFGVFELVIFVTSPILGRYLTQIGSNFMYCTGLWVTGATAIVFGLLNLVPAGTTFITFAFLIRIVEAMGDSAIVTASFAIVAKVFTDRVATTIGILETFGGLGFAAGPPIGGALYEAGGFQLPFMVLGSFLIVAGMSSFCVLPKQNDAPIKFNGNIFRLLRKQAVLTMAFAVITAAVSISFLDPTLQPHLSDFNLSPVLVGLMFLIMGGTYAASAPFWGYLVDRKDGARSVMLFGCMANFVSLLFIGPCPIFPFEKQLWLVAVSEIFMGIGLGALFIPPFQQCLIVARSDGYPDTFETYGLVSGVYQSAQSLGAFFGPTIGGLGVELIGFPWTASVVALINVVCAALIICLILSEKRKQKPVKGAEIRPQSMESVPFQSPFGSHHELKSASLLSGSSLLRDRQAAAES